MRRTSSCCPRRGLPIPGMEPARRKECVRIVRVSYISLFGGFESSPFWPLQSEFPFGGGDVQKGSIGSPDNVQSQSSTNAA